MRITISRLAAGLLALAVLAGGDHDSDNNGGPSDGDGNV